MTIKLDLNDLEARSWVHWAVRLAAEETIRR